MIKCEICKQEFNTPKQLSWHVKHHNLTNKQYYDIYIKISDEGICKTCGKQTTFISMNLGYHTYCNKQCAKNDNQLQIKRMNTNLKKYGYKTSFSTKETQEKVKQIFVQKYGVTNPFAANEIKNKIKQTNIIKYGVENSQQRADIKQKTQQTNLKKYGNICAMQNDQIQSQIKQIMLDKYGSENIFGSEYGKQKIRETNLLRYGVENPQQNREIHIKSTKPYKYNGIAFDSSWELAVYIYCVDHDINVQREPITFKYVNNQNKESYYFPDFLIENSLIEIKGDQYLDTDGTLQDKAKLKCMQEHNVSLWTHVDVQPYINYCQEKFRDVLWYNQFR